MNTTTLPQPKVRNSNLELYRILVMLAIVAHHYVVNSGLMQLMDADPLNPKSIFFVPCRHVGQDRHQLFCADNWLLYV